MISLIINKRRNNQELNHVIGFTLIDIEKEAHNSIQKSPTPESSIPTVGLYYLLKPF